MEFLKHMSLELEVAHFQQSYLILMEKTYNKKVKNLEQQQEEKQDAAGLI